MNRCALCDAELGKGNSTKEHILPHAIGGHLKVEGFICLRCNNESGSTWDAELAKQLGWWSTALNVKRESGTAPPKQKIRTTTGEELWMHSNGSLSPAQVNFRESTTEDGKQRITFQARTLDEARKLLKGIQKKYPDKDLMQAVEGLKFSSHPLEDSLQIQFSVGGENAGRSIVKTATAMTCYLSIPIADCDFALRYLTDQNAEAAWSAFHLRDLVKNRPPKHLVHVAAVTGDPTSGRLLGYVEYFSAFRYVVLLSEKYQGPAITGCYAVNPATGENLSIEVDVSLSDEEAAFARCNEAYLCDAQIAHIECALPIVLIALNARGRDRLLDELILDAFRECGVGAGQELPPEKSAEFSAKVADKTVDLFLRLGYIRN